MPKTNFSLEELRNSYFQWLGDPAWIVEQRRGKDDEDVPPEMDILIFQPSNADNIADEEMFTFLLTAGISTRKMGGGFPYIELSIRVDGRHSNESIDTLAKSLSEFAVIPFREGKHLEPELIVRNVHLPIFDKMDAIILTHWNVNSPKQLPGLKPPVVVLRIVPLFSAESDMAAEIGANEIFDRFNSLGINRYMPGRQQVSLDGQLKELTTKEEPMKEANNIPEKIIAVWEDIEAWLQEKAPQRFKELGRGATAKELNQLEQKIGHELSNDYKASLQQHNGDIFLHSYKYMAIKDVIFHWEEMLNLSQAGKFKGNEPIYNEGKELQDSWWHESWIPFAMDSGGNYFAIDTLPGKNGVYGQVLRWEKVEGPIISEFKSFLEWLQDFLNGLKDGRYVVNDEGFIDPV